MTQIGVDGIVRYAFDAYPSLFKPVHGSAPDIAEQRIANPVGQAGTETAGRAIANGVRARS